MTNNNVLDLALPEEKGLLAPVLREGARQLHDQAIRAEVAELLPQYEHEKTPGGHQRVVRNGCQPKRDLLTGIGKIEVQMPKVRSREGEPVSFQSSLAPPYIRKTAPLEAAIP